MEQSESIKIIICCIYRWVLINLNVWMVLTYELRTLIHTLAHCAVGSSQLTQVRWDSAVSPESGARLPKTHRSRVPPYFLCRTRSIALICIVDLVCMVNWCVNKINAFVIATEKYAIYTYIVDFLKRLISKYIYDTCKQSI